MSQPTIKKTIARPDVPPLNGLLPDPAPLSADLPRSLGGRPSIDEVISGLSHPQKQLPSKLFYDEHGSQLFDQICGLSEYYVARAEISLMEAHAADIAAEIGGGALIIEYGSGSSTKTRFLLSHLDRPAGYVPIDISAEYLMASAGALKRDFPDLEIHPVAADFTGPISLPLETAGSANRLIYFPGSTIGNFERAEAVKLLADMAELAGPKGRLLIGVDLDKSPSVLRHAYNDRGGVTAEFNRNILVRLNREYGSDFIPEQFEHRAVYVPQHSRVEMHLVSRARQAATVCGQSFTFEPGETILTEYSHKYTVESFRDIAAAAGVTSRRVWTDSAGLFSVHLLDVT